METINLNQSQQLQQEKDKLLSLKKSTEQNLDKIASGDFGKELLTELEKREKISQLERNIYRIESLINIVNFELSKITESFKMEDLNKLITSIEDFKMKYPSDITKDIELKSFKEARKKYDDEFRKAGIKISEERQKHLQRFSKEKFELDFLNSVSDEDLIEEQKLLLSRIGANYSSISEEESIKRKAEFKRRYDLIESILNKRKEKLPEQPITPLDASRPTRSERRRAQPTETKENYASHIRRMALDNILQILSEMEESGANPKFLENIKNNLETIIKKVLKESTPQGSSIKVYDDKIILEKARQVLNEISQGLNGSQTTTETTIDTTPRTEIPTSNTATEEPTVTGELPPATPTIKEDSKSKIDTNREEESWNIIETEYNQLIKFITSSTSPKNLLENLRNGVYKIKEHIKFNPKPSLRENNILIMLDNLYKSLDTTVNEIGDDISQEEFSNLRIKTTRQLLIILAKSSGKF